MKPRLIQEKENGVSELTQFFFFFLAFFSLLFMSLICKDLELGGVTVWKSQRGENKGQDVGEATL